MLQSVQMWYINNRNNYEAAMTKDQFIFRINQRILIISQQRDSLREDISDAKDLLANWEDAIEQLNAAVDTLSELV